MGESVVHRVYVAATPQQANGYFGCAEVGLIARLAIFID
jgi:hypothetical protein